MLADDHRIVREGVRTLLEADPRFTVVGEADGGLALLPLVERLRPRVLLLDLRLPGLSGLDALRLVAERCKETRTLVLTMHAELEYVAQAFERGATGYILKGTSAADLRSAVVTVAAGGRYLGPPLSEQSLREHLEARKDRTDPYDSLTPREREVLQLVAEGLTNVAVAERLAVSRRTVEVHRSRVMDKLGLRTQTDLLRFALRRGIVKLDDDA